MDIQTCGPDYRVALLSTLYLTYQRAIRYRRTEADPNYRKAMFI